MNRSQLIAYLAGLIDGEGSFSIQIQIRYYKDTPSVRINPRIAMSIKYGAEVLKELQQTFGGQIYHYSNDEHRWNLSKKELILLASEELLPYLRIKKRIAQRFIEAVRLMPNKRASHRLGDRTFNKKTALKISQIAFTLNDVSETRTEMKMNTLNKIKDFYDET